MKFKVEGFFKQARYTVVEANSPEEAMEKAREKARFLIDKQRRYGLGFEITGATQVDELWKNDPTDADTRRAEFPVIGKNEMQRIVREIIKMHLHLSKPNLRRTVFIFLRSLHISLSAFAKNNPSSICYYADMELKALYRDFRESSLRKWLPDLAPKELPLNSIRRIVKDIFYLYSDVASEAERRDLTAGVLKAIHKFFLDFNYKEKRVLAELEKQIKALE